MIDNEAGALPTVPPGERPESVRSLDDIVGQAEAVHRLKALVALARSQGRAAPHLLLLGRSGTGKRTLAMALAKEMGAGIVTTGGAALQSGADLMGILTNLAERDVLFIDEVHRLPRVMEELLCPAMKDFGVNFVMDLKGLNARTLRIPIRSFTCVGAANTASSVQEALRSCFTVVIEIKPYSEDDLVTMAHRLAGKEELELTPEAAGLIARASNQELQTVRAILNLVGRPTTRRVEPQDVMSALAILGRAPHATGRGPLDTDALAQLSGQEFERWVGALLGRFGFRVEVTQASGDGGIDIVAVLDRPLVGGRYLVQCKRYSPDVLVGVQAIREFYGTLVADRGTTKGLFITTSAFTAQARDFARTLPLELIDGSALRALLDQTGNA